MNLAIWEKANGPVLFGTGEYAQHNGSDEPLEGIRLLGARRSLGALLGLFWRSCLRTWVPRIGVDAERFFTNAPGASTSRFGVSNGQPGAGKAEGKPPGCGCPSARVGREVAEHTTFALPQTGRSFNKGLLMPSKRRHSLARAGGIGQPRGAQFAAALAVLLAVVLARGVSAQSEADRATARSLAAEGYTALQASDFATAEDRFRRADALVHAPTLVVDHARALVGLGRLVEAHERYELVLREGVPANAPRVWKQAISDAEQELAALKPRLAWLVLYVDAPEDASVRVDTADVPRAALGVPRATDPGSRSVTVSASGFLTQDVQVDLSEGERRELRFRLEVDPSVVPLEEAPPTKPEPAAPAPPESDTSWLLPQRTWAYIALGVGAAGVIGGGVTGGLFLREGSDLEKKCPDPDRCPAVYEDDVKRYRRLGWASGIGLGVGVAGLAAGAYLYLTEDEEERESVGASGGILPLLTYDGVGVWGRF